MTAGGPRSQAGPAAGKHFHPNLWPRRPAGLKEAYIGYYRAISSLAATLMRIFALALDLDEHFFAGKLDKAVNKLTAIRYPAQMVVPFPCTSATAHEGPSMPCSWKGQ